MQRHGQVVDAECLDEVGISGSSGAGSSAGIQFRECSAAVYSGVFTICQS